jgi:hypothetical protein
MYEKGQNFQVVKRISLKVKNVWRLLVFPFLTFWYRCSLSFSLHPNSLEKMFRRIFLFLKNVVEATTDGFEAKAFYNFSLTNFLVPSTNKSHPVRCFTVVIIIELLISAIRRTPLDDDDYVYVHRRILH